MPKKIDLSELNLVELKELGKSINKAIGNAERAARKRALEEVKKAAEKHGFSLGDLVDRKSKRSASKSKMPPKYRNPKNVSETWSGRGRQPEWFKAAVESRTPREKMAI